MDGAGVHTNQESGSVGRGGYIPIKSLVLLAGGVHTNQESGSVCRGGTYQSRVWFCLQRILVLYSLQQRIPQLE